MNIRTIVTIGIPSIEAVDHFVIFASRELWLPSEMASVLGVGDRLRFKSGEYMVSSLYKVYNCICLEYDYLPDLCLEVTISPIQRPFHWKNEVRRNDYSDELKKEGWTLVQ